MQTAVYQPVGEQPGPAGSRAGGKAGRERVMRSAAVAVAALVAAGVLAAGGVFLGGQLGKESGSTTAATETAATTGAPTTSAQAAPVIAPSAGAPLSTVLAWIQAGSPVDAAKFHTATDRDGAESDLGSAVAFVSPTKKIQCMTPRRDAPVRQGLSCLVNFDNPAPRPAAHPNGEWVAGWVDFPGDTAGVGRLASDPGQFAVGVGATLAYGSRLSFDDYECRMDQTGLLCVDQSAGSALQLSSSGPVPFGCLAKTASESYGLGYSCPGAGAAATTRPAR